MKKIVHHVKDELFKTQILFIAGCDSNEMMQVLKKFKIKNLDPDFYKGANGVTSHFTEEDSSRVLGDVFMIWIADRKDFYTLLHEVSHFVIRVFEIRGVPINKETQEVFAYHQELTFKRLWHLASKK